MRCPPVHPLTLWLSLIAFLISSTVVRTGLVVCDDGHGNSRLEWRCERNVRGECLTTCDDSGSNDDDGAPHPCDDKPAAPDIVKASPASSTQVEWPAVAAPAALTVLEELPVPQPGLVCGQTDWARAHPPDHLALLRCVILLV